jgi:hypothetical protein
VHNSLLRCLFADREKKRIIEAGGERPEKQTHRRDGEIHDEIEN